MGEPVFYFRNAISRGGGRESGRGFGGEVELGVISITVEVNVKFVEDIAEGKEVDDEEEGPQDRALGHTSSDGGGDGFKGFQLNELSAAREVRCEPV